MTPSRSAEDRRELPQEFTATLVKSPAKGGHTYVVWPASVEFFGTRGRVKEAGQHVTVVVQEQLNES